ncbi:MAG: NAD(P)H-hydrate dehydratase [Maritimibacter harenae]
MYETLTAAQMRAIETEAIEAGSVTGLTLMERAGQGVVDAIRARWPDRAAAPGRALVLAGPGNNGGDGFVIARLLKTAGWQVDLFLFGSPEKLPPDAKANAQRWSELGETHDLEPALERGLDLARYELAIDALFGTGLTRPVALPLPEVSDVPAVVAVDIPTGLCADSGRRIGQGALIRADLTVTFHARKLGHVLAEGPAACGALVVHDIGLPSGGGETGLVTPDPEALQKHQGHKYGHGHALVLSGPATRTGAARLSARAALRVGAGLVTLGAPRDAMAECAAQLTAIMLRDVEDGAALTEVLGDDRLNALALGPGLGPDRARDLAIAALEARRATVLDADALTAFAGDPDALFARLHPACVLTPHGGEFARLFPDLADRLSAPAERGPAYSKLDATRDAAARAGCTVLFKGMDTVIASETGAARIHCAAYDRAAPWLATAGAGDVLTGLIAGLLARGLSPLSAASQAAWLHVEAARRFGPGLIAEDLPETLPAVLRAQGA